MKKIKNITALFLTFALIFTPSVHVFAKEDSTNDEKSIKQVIDNYFETYFKSLETLNKPNYEGIVEENSNTLTYVAANELQVEQYKLINMHYQNAKYKIDFTDFNVSNSNADVKVKMGCNYNYSSTPNDQSIMSNIGYDFYLDKVQNKWVITMIDSDYDQFTNFKDTVENKLSRGKRDVDSSKTIIQNIKEQFINDTKNVVANLAGAPNSDKTPKDKDSNKRVKRYTSFPYDSSRGVFYAQVHAPEGQANKSFYRASIGGDCTNFVSQCIWYSYGGENSGISRKSRMTSNWYGGSGGGSTPWESVEGLWSQVVDSYPGNGPNGTGYNNNEPYYNFAPGRIYVGEVIQVKNVGSRKYEHSVYVTSSNNGNNKYYNEILVSQHSSDIFNRNLYDIIISKGGNSCYMRDIAFTSANLNP